MTVATVHGARPLSKPPFLTMGVGTEQPAGFTVVVVVTVVVKTVVGVGWAVNIQEQALLKREAGYVVAAKSRFAGSSSPRFAAPAVTVALGWNQY